MSTKQQKYQQQLEIVRQEAYNSGYRDGNFAGHSKGVEDGRRLGRTECLKEQSVDLRNSQIKSMNTLARLGENLSTVAEAISRFGMEVR